MNADCLSILSHNDVLLLGNTRARLNCVETQKDVEYLLFVIHSMIPALSYYGVNEGRDVEYVHKLQTQAVIQPEALGLGGKKQMQGSFFKAKVSKTTRNNKHIKFWRLTPSFT